ncbi:hypothetical protein V6N13_148166 [Hibiscus sabdariffa]
MRLANAIALLAERERVCSLAISELVGDAPSTSKLTTSLPSFLFLVIARIVGLIFVPDVDIIFKSSK